jgi:acyl carrier protein
MTREALEALVIEVLRSKVPRFEGKIQPDTPLGAGGLAIDSIGTLEIVLEVERRSGIRLRDESLSADALASPRRLVDYLTALRENPDG